MRIAFLIPNLWRGGAERVLSIMANNFSQNGHNVYIILTDKNPVVSYSIDNEVRIVSSNLSNGSRIHYIDHVKEVYRTICEENIEIVVSFITWTNIIGIKASKKAGIPIIISERNCPDSVPGRKLLRIIRNHIYSKANGIVLQNTYAYNYYLRHSNIEGIIIWNPINIDGIQSLPYMEREDCFITACRLAPQKNVFLLIDAFYLIHKKTRFNLYIYGDGPLKTAINERIMKYNISDRVILMGESDDVLSIMARSKIFVLSSDFEGLSNSVMEALCVGCACIVTDSLGFGNRELIKDGHNGILVPTGDPEELSKQMLYVANNAKVGEKLANNARLLYDKCNYNQVYCAWQEYVYKTLRNK